MAAKFNLNRPPVKDEEINSHKNFGELVDKFKKQSIEKARSDVNFLKNKKVTYSAIIAGVAVVCTVTYFAVFKKESPKETANDTIVTSQNQLTNIQKNKQNKAFIAPPISKLNVPYTSYKVKAEQGATIKHTSNSKIIIPKKAFVNKQGQEIVGDVEIKYREIHNQADIIASGIPMQYDSANVKYTFESAGMIDIKGYQNGKPVFINSNKQITVEFQSEQPADKFNMYILDTIAKNWVYLNRDNSLRNSESKIHKPIENIESQKTIEIQKQLDAIPPKVEAEKNVYLKKTNQLPKIINPPQPIKATEGRQQFELDVDYKEFPELTSFKNAVFEVGNENKVNANKIAEITWNSAEISEGPIKGKNYLLTLKTRDKTEKLIVYPVLKGKNFDDALKIYEAKFKEYQKDLAKKEANEKRLKEEFEAKQAVYIAEQKQLTDNLLKERIRIRNQQEKQINKQIGSISNYALVTRIFNVTQFGIYNSDCPTKLPNEEKLFVTFNTNKNGKITPKIIYLVSHDKNLVYTFNQNFISYNKNENYSLCIATDDYIYHCDKNSLKKCLEKNQSEIPVIEISQNISNTNDFKKILGI
jgi:hypothetical protein